MAWTTPATWSASLVTVNAMNVGVRDNLNALKDPPSGLSYVSARDYVVAGAGAWTAVDTGLVAGHLQHAVTHAGDQVVVRFLGSIILKMDTGAVGFNISVNGTPYFPGAGIHYINGGNITNMSALVQPVSFEVPLTGLTPGTNTFRLDWSANNTVTTLYGSGTTNRWLPILFHVVEIP